MLDRAHQSVIVGRAFVANDHGPATAPLVLVTLGRILLSEQEPAGLVSSRRAISSGGSSFNARDAGDHACAACSARPPHTGNEYSWIKAGAQWIVPGRIANVIHLRLPALPKLLLNAECPLQRVGRLELLYGYDVLRLRKEQSLRWRWNCRLRKWARCKCAIRPRVAEVDRRAARCLGLVHGCGKRWILLVALCRK